MAKEKIYYSDKFIANTGVEVSGVTKTDSILLGSATAPIAGSILTLANTDTSTGATISSFHNLTKANTVDAPYSANYGTVNRYTDSSNFSNGFLITQNNIGKTTGSGDVDGVYAVYNQSNIDGSGTVNNAIASYNLAELDNASGTVNTIIASYLEVGILAGTVGEVSVLSVNYNQSIGTSITGDFQFINVPNKTVLGVSGTARALNIESDLPSYFEGSIGIGVNSPKSKLQVNGGVQMSDDTDTASADKAGTLRYREGLTESYVDMCMRNSSLAYEWVNILTK